MIATQDCRKYLIECDLLFLGRKLQMEFHQLNLLREMQQLVVVEGPMAQALAADSVV